MTRLTQVDPSLAEGGLAQTFAMIERTLGRVPNMARAMGVQPIYLDIYMMMRAKLAEGRFDARTKEAIAIAIAADNGCDYCLAAHSAAAMGAYSASAEDVAAWRAGSASDVELGVLVQLALRLNQTRGQLEAADLEAASAAGLSDADLIEVLGIVVMNIATNYFNRLAQTDIDFPMVEPD